MQVQGGSGNLALNNTVKLEKTLQKVGPVLSIALSEDAGSNNVWFIEVWVQYETLGISKLGEFSTNPPAAGDPPNRIVAFACCPGAKGWHVQAKCPTNPAALADLNLDSSEGCGIGTFGITVNNAPGPDAMIIHPFRIIQQEPGTPTSPVAYTPWEVFFSDHAYPSISMFLYGTLFNSTIDFAFGFGPNADSSVATKPRSTLTWEQDYEPIPGTHQMEVYFDVESSPGNVATYSRPFGFVHFIAGPNAGKGQPTVQYTSSFVIVGGTSLANALQLTIQDNAILITPTNYLMQAAGDFAIQALGATGLTLLASGAGGNVILQSITGGLYSFADIVHFSRFNQTPASTYNTNTNVFAPTTDATGSLGVPGNRWSLVRAVTITSGDLHLEDEERGAHWILREEKDCILAINEVTKQTFKLHMVPEDEGYEAHSKKIADQKKAREIRAKSAQSAEVRQIGAPLNVERVPVSLPRKRPIPGKK